jgi:hypothetical protein
VTAELEPWERDDVDPPEGPRPLEILDVLRSAGVLTDVGLRLDDPNLPFERYQLIGVALAAIGDAARFGLGDWMMFGERVYGDLFYQAAEATGLSESTLGRYFWVASKIDYRRRRLLTADGKRLLTWTHHQEVARLLPDEQDEMLDRAVVERWTVANLREAVRGLDAIAAEPVAPVVEDDEPLPIIEHDPAPPTQDSAGIFSEESVPEGIRPRLDRLRDLETAAAALLAGASQIPLTTAADRPGVWEVSDELIGGLRTALEGE